ncbi:MAG: PilZ domain-containing protein [Planctomycetia bacterium]|nr:PilZ domain-containing protein [Planctomycetia bacterium]
MGEPAPAVGSTHPAGAERRASVRYYFSNDPERQPSAALTENRWAARVRDISSTGVGLLCDRAFDGGRLLRVEVQATGTTIPLQVCVVRSVKQPGGAWLVGAAFTEKLSDEQLSAVQRTAG